MKVRNRTCIEYFGVEAKKALMPFKTACLSPSWRFQKTGVAWAPRKSPERYRTIDMYSHHLKGDPIVAVALVRKRVTPTTGVAPTLLLYLR